MASYYAILPLITAIAGAAATKRIIPSLTAGLLVGTLLKTGSLTGMLLGAGNYLAGVVADPDNAYIILFLFCFGALAEILKLGGGISGFAKAVKPYIKTEKGVMLSVWAATPISFLDCCFHVIATTSITKPLLENVKASKTKLAFIINTTSSQLIVLIPFATTYVGYILGVIAVSMSKAGLSGNTYLIYLSAVLLNFYSIIILIISILAIFFDFKFIGRLNKIFKPRSHQSLKQSKHEKSEAVEQGEFAEKTKPKLMNLIIPLLFMLAMITYLLWLTGHRPNSGFFQALINADYEKAIFVATIATLVITAAFYAAQKIALKDLESCFLTGGMDLLPPIVILILAWSITAVTKDLGFTKVIDGLFKASFPHQLVPLIIFLIGGLVSYFIGSAWGTWALLMPVAFSLIASTGASIPLTIGAVLAGGSIGDNISPLGETPVTTASIMRIPLLQHTGYILPYGITAIILAAVLYLMTGYLI